MFKVFLWAQLVWLVLAVSFNLTSIYLISTNQAPLYNSNPKVALVSLAPFAISIAIGFFQKYKAFVILTGLLIIGLFLRGVLPHVYAGFFSENLNDYSSKMAWQAALLINVYGLGVFFTALVSAQLKVGKFKEQLNEFNG